MFSYKHILYLLILFPFLSWGGNLDFNRDKVSQGRSLNKLGVPNYSGENGRLMTFNHKPYASFGYRNFMLDYNGTLQFKKWFEIGAGIGYHHNTVKFYSASDKHTVGLASVPTYLTATIYPYHDDNRAFYIKGNYGLANSINGAKNKKDKNFRSKVVQGGAGYKQFSDRLNRFFYVELSQYYTSAKGTYSDFETYNATIDYDFQFYGIVLSVGINLNRL
jgi:hypothetical protein